MSDREIQIEACVNSVESALAAEAGGANRVELCDNLYEGGTTPSVGATLAARKRLEIELNVIIRPRGGDFLYSDLELDIMKAALDPPGVAGALPRHRKSWNGGTRGSPSAPGASAAE